MRQYNIHYLDQWWYVIDTNLKTKFQWNGKRNLYIFNHENASAKLRPCCLGLGYVLNVFCRTKSLKQHMTKLSLTNFPVIRHWNLFQVELPSIFLDRISICHDASLDINHWQRFGIYCCLVSLDQNSYDRAWIANLVGCKNVWMQVVLVQQTPCEQFLLKIRWLSLNSLENDFKRKRLHERQYLPM